MKGTVTPCKEYPGQFVHRFTYEEGEVGDIEYYTVCDLHHPGTPSEYIPGFPIDCEAEVIRRLQIYMDTGRGSFP